MTLPQPLGPREHRLAPDAEPPTPPPLLGRLRLSARTPQLKMAFLLITKKKKKNTVAIKQRNNHKNWNRT